MNKFFKVYIVSIAYFFMGIQNTDANTLVMDGDTLFLKHEPLLWGLDAKTSAKWRSLIETKPSYITDFPQYVTSWEIDDDKLYLNGVVFSHDMNCEEVTIYDVEALKDIFSAYYQDGRIYARWYKGPLNLKDGNILYSDYRYIGERYDENEIDIKIVHGVVKSKKYYHNYITPGLTFEEAHEEFNRRFPKDEFVGKGRGITFLLTINSLDEEGKITDMKLEIARADGFTEEDKLKALAITEEIWKNLPPIQTICYRNKRVTIGRNYAIVVKFDGK